MKNLILFPLRKERQAFLSSLQELDVEFQLHSKYKNEVTIVESLNAAIVTGGVGISKMKLSTERWLGKFPNIDLIVCAGSSGQIGSIQVLDVVIADRTSHVIRKSCGELKVNAIYENQSIEKPSANLNFKLHRNSVTSFEEDVIDSSIGLQLHQLTGAVSTAWEGAGAAAAAATHQKAFLEVRAVTDNCNVDTPVDLLENLNPAMRHLAQILQILLSQTSNFENK